MVFKDAVNTSTKYISLIEDNVDWGMLAPTESHKRVEISLPAWLAEPGI